MLRSMSRCGWLIDVAAACVCLCLCAVIAPIAFTATVMPFQVFFLGDTSNDLGWNVVDIIITICFGLDILMSFNIGYFDAEGWPVNDRWVPSWPTGLSSRLNRSLSIVCRCVGLIRRKTIALNYLKTFLIIDLVSLPPYSTCMVWACVCSW